MPVIIPDPPEANRRRRIRTVIQVVAIVLGSATALLGATWWAWIVAALLGLLAFGVARLDSWEPWWPPSHWLHAAKGHNR